MRVLVRELTCKFCGTTITDRCHRSYQANPFCGDRTCYERRLEASGAVDLRDNARVIVHENGFVSIEPIDPTKLFKATVQTNG